MHYDTVTSVASIGSELEDVWKKLDEVYSTLPQSQWSKKFGKTWVYADQPYHLAYFDRLISGYISKGANVPKEEQILYRTIRDLADWNARMFASKPMSQTVEQSLGQMRQERDVIRQMLSRMHDRDLEAKAWMPLFGGWGTAREHLHAVLLHTIAEYTKLWIRTGKRGPMLNPSGVHLRLGFLMNFMALTMDKAAAANKDFTVTWNFTGPGGGAWTFRVKDGSCILKEETASDPNLIISMKPETLQKLAAKMEPPPMLMLKGEMKIKGFFAMPTFAKLFPEPRADQVIHIGSQGGALG
ncbi:MAG: SCP2 sterol-binding domain-containing protein [Ignavibacteriales bacterium]|nr:SCP2 sterol-binding domain-containing protein [Ignavibacteriales bacterium]